MHGIGFLQRTAGREELFLDGSAGTVFMEQAGDVVQPLRASNGNLVTLDKFLQGTQRDAFPRPSFLVLREEWFQFLGSDISILQVESHGDTDHAVFLLKLDRGLMDIRKHIAELCRFEIRIQDIQIIPFHQLEAGVAEVAGIDSGILQFSLLEVRAGKIRKEELRVFDMAESEGHFLRHADALENALLELASIEIRFRCSRAVGKAGMVFELTEFKAGIVMEMTPVDGNSIESRVLESSSSDRYAVRSCLRELAVRKGAGSDVRSFQFHTGEVTVIELHTVKHAVRDFGILER